jgi:hypothetical protein
MPDSKWFADRCWSGRAATPSRRSRRAEDVMGAAAIGVGATGIEGQPARWSGRFPQTACPPVPYAAGVSPSGIRRGGLQRGR